MEAGQVFPAGEYEFAVDGRYWTDFDRQHPIEGPARDKAWTGTAHALIANLGIAIGFNKAQANLVLHRAQLQRLDAMLDQ